VAPHRFDIIPWTLLREVPGGASTKGRNSTGGRGGASRPERNSTKATWWCLLKGIIP